MRKYKFARGPAGSVSSLAPADEGWRIHSWAADPSNSGSLLILWEGQGQEVIDPKDARAELAERLKDPSQAGDPVVERHRFTRISATNPIVEPPDDLGWQIHSWAEDPSAPGQLLILWEIEAWIVGAGGRLSEKLEGMFERELADEEP